MRDDNKSMGNAFAPNRDATHYHAQIELPDKGRAINWLVVCYLVCLVSMKGMGLRTCARCAGLVPYCGLRAQVPQHPIEI